MTIKLYMKKILFDSDKKYQFFSNKFGTVLLRRRVMVVFCFLFVFLNVIPALGGQKKLKEEIKEILLVNRELKKEIANSLKSPTCLTSCFKANEPFALGLLKAYESSVFSSLLESVYDVVLTELDSQVGIDYWRMQNADSLNLVRKGRERFSERVNQVQLRNPSLHLLLVKTVIWKNKFLLQALFADPLSSPRFFSRPNKGELPPFVVGKSFVRDQILSRSVLGIPNVLVAVNYSDYIKLANRLVGESESGGLEREDWISDFFTLFVRSQLVTVKFSDSKIVSPGLFSALIPGLPLREKIWLQVKKGYNLPEVEFMLEALDGLAGIRSAKDQKEFMTSIQSKYLDSGSAGNFNIQENAKSVNLSSEVQDHMNTASALEDFESWIEGLSKGFVEVEDMMNLNHFLQRSKSTLRKMLFDSQSTLVKNYENYTKIKDSAQLFTEYESLIKKLNNFRYY